MGGHLYTEPVSITAWPVSRCVWSTTLPQVSLAVGVAVSSDWQPC